MSFLLSLAIFSTSSFFFFSPALSPFLLLQKTQNRTVPIRVIGDGDENDKTLKLTAEKHPRVLLVTSRSGAGLVFPKGGWETDESCEAAAARETVEEAGVRGDLEPEPLGTFRFASSKKAAAAASTEDGSGNGNGNGGEEGNGEAKPKSSAATMFCLRVREELREWPESAQRCRVWLSPGDALAACKHGWMREALGVWAARHGIGGSDGEEASRNGEVGPSSSSSSAPLEPSPGGRERAAAAAIEAANAAGLAVVPWIKIAGEEEEEDEGGGGGGGRREEEGAKPAKK